MSDEKWVLIEKLDLGSVTDRFADKKGWWWRLWHTAEKVEAEYRQFLYLIATNPGKTVVPWSQDLDDYWHTHILDTVKYKADCEAIAGRAIDHNPHLPQGTPEQAAAFKDTKTMYREAFKDKADAQRAGSSSSSAAGCGTVMPIIFCGTVAAPPPSSSYSSGSSCSSGSSGSGSSCGSSSASSCGSSSCGSSCGGGGCGSS